ncbi:MAG: glycogen/starch/alpha-glucan phosphorylase [Acidobacteriota bacterium]
MSATPKAKLRQGQVLRESIVRHLQSTLGIDPDLAERPSMFQALAYAVRDRLIERWLETQRSCYELLVKRAYYLSLEFLPGRFLRNYLLCLGMEEEANVALSGLGWDLEDIEEEEWDAGLGNGGLGRLASCFLDSMATLQLPGYGYGIRYDFGIFHQKLVDGYQQEECDNWMRQGSPWEIQRPEVLYRVQLGGRSEAYQDSAGRLRYRWVDADSVMALASDILIPGFGGEYATHMRLWVARSSFEFNLAQFNLGDYVGAVEAKVVSENISKVLYPNDEVAPGRELRLKQQYFFVSATLQDILRRFRKQHQDWSSFPDFVAIQLNDTHPSLAVPELMRLLMDVEDLGWDEAWRICERTFGYTNHTVLPEALETWSVDLLGRLLPRHLEIIFEINQRFLDHVRERFPSDPERLGRVSLVQEGNPKRVRMAHLAIVGGHAVNGVAALHSDILRRELFRDFEEIFPGRIRNVTNGITPRRWLRQANPALSLLITEAVGPTWLTDLDRLQDLGPLSEDPAFRDGWIRARRENKQRLARYVLRKMGLGVNPDTMFDVQVKRIHEYKRQLLNALHVVALFNRIKDAPQAEFTPRTIVFAGKAAPAYRQAKLIIKLINSIAAVVNVDPDVRGRLRILFLPNYCVSQAEKVIPAADLSEQISTAGMEASGTGNMKFALNGALTIGTLDGANIEIVNEVGRENIFIFGLTADEVVARRARGGDSREFYDRDGDLRRVLEMIGGGAFSPDQPRLFQPIVQSLLEWGDFFQVLADFRAYVLAQDEVSRLYGDPDEWARRSILNCARMGRFSSDRAILEYADGIWDVSALDLE